MIFFIWGRWRYDVVAVLALLAASLLGIVPAQQTFSGLGHPAVITVAAVLIISKALQNSGILDHFASYLVKTTDNTLLYTSLLVGVAAILSAFMNNVGALALLMPLALRSTSENKIPPAAILMPLSFGTILGGLMTLMGTPPNIIIASYRQQISGEPFAIFDFAPVGFFLALAGVIFVTLIGQKLIPKARRGKQSPEELFEINDYIVEAVVTSASQYLQTPVSELEKQSENFEIVGLLRGQQRIMGKRHLEQVELREKDILILETDPGKLPELLEKLGLELVSEVALKKKDLDSEEVSVVEAVVVPGSRVEKRSFQNLRLQSRYGIALLGIARQGRSLKQRLNHVNLQAGDILLVQGETTNVFEMINRLGCLPLAKRNLKVSKPDAFWPIAGFATALTVSAMGWVPVHIAFCTTIALLGLFKIFPMRDAYEAIDWPVILLLAAMIPLGQALENTGGTALITDTITGLSAYTGPVVILTIVMIVTMTLSDIMNNAATAVIMAPIATAVAIKLGVNPDAFLMAVAVGASCAFLTPIGHQNNILVMGPGGYRFGDYWRLGLPLEILIIALGVPLICWFWPL